MSDISMRVIRERRMNIDGSSATVSREGRSITISYSWAGRFTKDDQRFYVEDILALAQFIADTNEQSGMTEEAIMSSISREERVARALYEQQFPGSAWPQSADRAESWREMARAAIAALSPDERLIEALEEIANPIAAMQKRAKAEGNRLSGMAYQIANDANYLKKIARDALSTTKADQ